MRQQQHVRPRHESRAPDFRRELAVGGQSRKQACSMSRIITLQAALTQATYNKRSYLRLVDGFYCRRSHSAERDCVCVAFDEATTNKQTKQSKTKRLVCEEHGSTNNAFDELIKQNWQQSSTQPIDISLLTVLLLNEVVCFLSR